MLYRQIYLLQTYLEENNMFKMSINKVYLGTEV